MYIFLNLNIGEIFFSAPDLKDKDVLIDSDYVNNKLKDIVKDRDLSKYIL